MNDSSGVDVEFRKDTVLTFSGHTIDTAMYQYDTAAQQVLIKDSLAETLSVVQLNDSLLFLKAKDNALLFLKKR
jgi:hypothetical protein